MEGNSFFQNTFARLSESSKELIEGKITSEECRSALSALENSKSPGNDVISAEFYKTFWHKLGSILVECFNELYEKGYLTNSQRQAVITLIEKKNKDRIFLKNWRPVSLLNVDYKIVSKALSIRIQKILPETIHSDQSAFVKGRWIGDYKINQ